MELKDDGVGHRAPAVPALLAYVGRSAYAGLTEPRAKPLMRSPAPRSGALGVPCLTMRDTTERPITITEGTNVLVGRDPARIVSEARRVLREGVTARRPALWDGRAGERIADVLLTEARARR